MPTTREFEKLVQSAADPAEILDTKNLSLDPVTWTEQTRILFGKTFSFKQREFLFRIMRDDAKEILIHKGRQMEISELLANMSLYFAWRYPESSVMYISDIASHAYTFSNDRIKDQAIKNSDIMQKIAQLKNHTTTKLTLENGSKIRFFSAFGDFQQARSYPVDFLILDEVQSMNLQNVANIRENLAHSKHKKLIAVGTGPIEGDEWEKWYKRGTEYNFHKTKKKWTAKNPQARIHSYWVPQTIAPWITKQELADKQEEYTPAEYQREVLGLAAKGDEIPITEAIVSSLMLKDEYLKQPKDIDRTQGPVGVSYDWGGGKISWTIAAAYQVINEKVPIIKMLNILPILDELPEDRAKKAINFAYNYDPDFMGMDAGGGAYEVSRMAAEFGPLVKKISYMARPSKPWKLEHYHSDNLITIDRTYSLEHLFDLMKRPYFTDGFSIPRLQIPAANENKIDFLFEHYTALYAIEPRKNVLNKNRLIYEKSVDKKSDALMNLNYFYIAWQAWKEKHAAKLNVSTGTIGK